MVSRRSLYAFATIAIGLGCRGANALDIRANASSQANIFNSSLPYPQISQNLVKMVMCLPQEVRTASSCSTEASTKGSGISSTGSDQSKLAFSPDINESVIDEASLNLVPPEVHARLAEEKPIAVGAQFDQGKISLALPAGAFLETIEKDKSLNESSPLVIDNDQALQTEETIKYKDLPTDTGKTKVLVGATFPVVMCSQVTSKSAHDGDALEARLKYDLKIGDRLIAARGALVQGHINYVLRARSAMHSLVSCERWYRNSGCLGVSFDQLINEKGEHIPLVAMPHQTARIVKNKYEGRVLGVNHNGQITGPWSQQLRYKAIRIGLNAAMAPAGVFSFGAMPVALGVIGAANPSFAFMKPVGQNVRHRRIKGFAWGFLSGVPGSWLVEDTVVKGQEAVIMPGDEMLAEFKQEFTGEPMTDASLMPGASVKVHGQVLPENKKK